jgi:hypothetical protein
LKALVSAEKEEERKEEELREYEGGTESFIVAEINESACVVGLFAQPEKRSPVRFSGSCREFTEDLLRDVSCVHPRQDPADRRTGVSTGQAISCVAMSCVLTDAPVAWNVQRAYADLLSLLI